MSTINSEPDLPDPTNLEIQATWNGEINHPARLKISLEIRSVPGTRLQLLDACHPGLTLHKTYSISHYDESSQGNESTRPESPLFAFSASDSDDCIEDSLHPTEIFTREIEGASSSLKPTPMGLDTNKFADDELRAKIPEHLDMSDPSTVTPLGADHGLCENIAKYDLQGLGKRNASIACLTDEEIEKKNALGPSERQNEAKTRRVVSTAPRGVKKSSKHCITHKRSTSVGTRRPSYSPSTEDLEKNIANHFKNIISDVCCGDTGFPFGKAIENIKGSTTDSIGTEGKQKHHVEPEAFFSDSPYPTQMEKALDIVSFEGPIGDTDDKPITGEFSASNLQIPIPRSHSADISDSECDDDTSDFRCVSNTSVDYPTLEIVDGILNVNCADDMQPATYRITINMSVILTHKADRNKDHYSAHCWHTISIPGLPKLKDSDSGFLLFLIPDGHGMEFSTENLHRYKIVENCFLAEFTDTMNFKVSIRLHDKSNYGVLKDFTVEHEIQATHKIHSIAGKPNITVTYRAICSLALPNSYLSAEKCCFFLVLEGGPEGMFQCALDPQKEGLQVIRLGVDRPTVAGVSDIQIVCSSRQLELFGLTWTVNLLSLQASCWLPRLYPTLSEASLKEKLQLRHTLSEVDSSAIDITLNNANEMAGSGRDFNEVAANKDGAAAINELLNPCETCCLAKDVTDSLSKPAKINPGNVNSHARNFWLKDKVLLGICGLLLMVGGMVFLLFFPNRTNTGAFDIPSLCNITWEESLLKEGGRGPYCTEKDGGVLQRNDLPGNASNTLAIQEGPDTSSLIDGSDETQEVPTIDTIADEVKASSDQSPSAIDLTLRDRIDYWLGWKGPADNWEA